ncbi:hypothetical protein ILYODFUR_028875 [Ilyodon furcidens]|uniref:Uncharacterized protein n=1 Tax=Ilyodon furcidens TaxID=33524 RepID=A0ABV0UAP6_9TELE
MVYFFFLFCGTGGFYFCKLTERREGKTCSKSQWAGARTCDEDCSLRIWAKLAGLERIKLIREAAMRPKSGIIEIHCLGGIICQQDNYYCSFASTNPLFQKKRYQNIAII